VERKYILNCRLDSLKIVGEPVMYCLGIDVGGSKTEVAISAEDGSVVSRESGPSCKPARVGRDAGEKNLEQLIHRVLSRAGLSGKQIACTCIGLSGISQDGAAAWADAAISRLVSGPVVVRGDHEIAHHAAFGREPGVLVIAGTGAIAFGRSPQNETARCGGWGPRFSDEGSANWIGELAIRKSLRGRDRGTGAPLLSRILEEREIPLERVLDPNAAFDCASLFPLIASAAHQGDMTAWYVLSEAGRELADMALAVAQKLHLVRGTVCAAGGVFRHAPLVRSAFRGALAANAAHLVYDEKPVDPVLGALDLAQRAIKP